jgi:hypothetical protein
MVCNVVVSFSNQCELFRWRSLCKQPINMTPKENIMRYSHARANMPPEMAEKAVPVRTISYEQIDGMKIKRDVIFCYDLEVPYFWQPKNNGQAHTLSSLASSLTC